jgi:PEP-CTERM motif
MKKSILIAILGVTASAATSFGQGYIAFTSYLANGGAGALTTFQGSSTPVPGTFSAELYYALGTVSDPVNGNPGSPVSGLFTAVPGSITLYDASNDGYFQGGTAILPTYASGAISFEVVAFGPAGAFGRSGAFTESIIASSASAPVTNFGDNGTGMPSFVVPVPEPTTLALAGLGGLASLVALRRKQA